MLFVELGLATKHLPQSMQIYLPVGGPSRLRNSRVRWAHGVHVVPISVVRQPLGPVS
jgi:hypothetical protein